MSDEEDGSQPTAEDMAGALPPLTRRVLLVAGGLLMTGSAAAAIVASVDYPGQARTSAAGRMTGTAVPVTGNEAARPQDAPRRGILPPAADEDAALPHASRGAAKQGMDRQAAARRGALPSEPLYRLGDDADTIALTIDDGPSPVYTPQILAVLEKYKVTASFSMVGRCVARYPAVARDVARAGHVIVNHTWDHANIAVLAAPLVRDEIVHASDVIHSATGQRPAWFRAPYGVWSPEVLRYCADNDLAALDWSVDPRDWSLPGTASIVRNILRNTRGGSIILEHDGGGDRAQTVAALRIVIPRLLDEGYRFRTP